MLSWNVSRCWLILLSLVWCPSVDVVGRYCVSYYQVLRRVPLGNCPCFLNFGVILFWVCNCVPGNGIPYSESCGLSSVNLLFRCGECFSYVWEYTRYFVNNNCCCLLLSAL
jgi:hypothetical protein